MIHDIHMAEEPFVLATAHDTEVHPIAVVLEHKSAAGREIAETAKSRVDVPAGL